MKLNDKDYNRIRTYYDEAYLAFGDRDVRSVHWSNKHDQETRFRALIQIASLEGAKVLDVGCGLGDLYKYLLQQEIEVDYTGIDIIPEFIKTAKRRYPSAAFEEMDLFEVNDTYDFVLASGAISFKVNDNENYSQQMIAKMYDIAQVGVAFNMLDNTMHVDNETYAAYSPEKIADYCSTLAHRVEIVVDYLPQDFAVYLLK